MCNSLPAKVWDEGPEINATVLSSARLVHMMALDGVDESRTRQRINTWALL